MEEIWKSVKGFEGYYEVSNLGNVRSVDRIVLDTVRNCERLLKGKVLVKKDNGYGYKCVMFCKEHKIYNKYVHRLVAEAFIPNQDKLPQVNHKDEDKSNNCVDNLEWCTQLYNNEYGTRKKRWYETRIENNTININHIGLGKTELRRAYNKEWRKNHPDYLRKYIRNR